MKKTLQSLLSLLLAIFFTFSTGIKEVQAMPDYPIDIVVNEHLFDVAAVNQPFVMGDISYIPMNFLIEEFGVDIKNQLEYDEDTKNLKGGLVINLNNSTSESKEVIINFDSPTYTIDGVLYDVTVTPSVKSSRICIPARTLASIFDLNISFDNFSKTLFLESNSNSKLLYN